MLSKETEKQIRDWRARNVNPDIKSIRPASHALRFLREVVELCIVSGANATEISVAMEAEIQKAIRRNDFAHPYSNEAVKDEVADCVILLRVFCDVTAIDPDAVAQAKIPTLNDRVWETDIDGVLWRSITS